MRATRPLLSARATALGQLLAALLALAAAPGCTTQHIQSETAQALEWLRLSNGSRIDATARWQLPRGTRIRVVETAPAPDPSWLAAAQAGVDRAYPGVGPAGDAPFLLLVSWPGESPEPLAREVSLWEVVDMDQFLPDFQQPMNLRIALVRSADGALVEAAALRATPHWFAPESSAPSLIRGAFRDFAETFATRY